MNASRILVWWLCGMGLCAAETLYLPVKHAALVSTSGAIVARADADTKGLVSFAGVKPGVYKVVLTNAAGSSVTVGDLNGDGVSDIVIADQAPPGDVKSPRDLATGQASGKVSMQDFHRAGQTPLPVAGDIKSPRDPASGLPTGKRQHQPPIICHLDWSGRVQGGLTSEADVTRAVSQLPPSKAGRCVVKITCDQQPGTIEIQSYSWGMSQTGTASMGGGLSQGKLIRRAVLQSTSGAVVATSDPDPSGRVLFTGVPPGEYKLLLTNEDGRTVTLSDWNGDGRSDLVVQGDGGAAGKVAVQDLSVSPRDVSTGQASGKRQHKPFACLVDWSGKVQGGFSSNAEASAVGRALPPSSAGRCIVQVTLEPQPGTIEIRSSWDLKSSKK